MIMKIRLMTAFLWQYLSSILNLIENIKLTEPQCQKTYLSHLIDNFIIVIRKYLTIYVIYFNLKSKVIQKLNYRVDITFVSHKKPRISVNIFTSSPSEPSLILDLHFTDFDQWTKWRSGLAGKINIDRFTG